MRYNIYVDFEGNLFSSLKSKIEHRLDNGWVMVACHYLNQYCHLFRTIIEIMAVSHQVTRPYRVKARCIDGRPASNCIKNVSVNQSWLFQIMEGVRSAADDYRKQCWLRSMPKINSPYLNNLTLQGRELFFMKKDDIFHWSKINEICWFSTQFWL